MQRRFVRDYEEILSNQKEQATTRSRSFRTKNLQGKQPLNVFADKLLKWPPHDIRYKDLTSLDPKLLKDIAKGMETKIVRKDITTGILDVVIEFQENLNEFERYNLAVGQHNREWEKQGRPKEVFDPVHGDVYSIKDTFVDPALISSKHHPMPNSAYSNVSSGKLAKARPQIERKGFVKIRYQLSVEDTLFTLGYAAYDYKNRIIYYNEVTHEDLSYLTRRSVQEIWGNHLAHGPEHTLDGISYLIQGRKIEICKKDNVLPGFLKDPLLKSPNIEIKTTHELSLAENKKATMSFSTKLFGYVVPVLLILYMIIFSYQCLHKAVYEETNTGGTYFLGMLFIIAGLIGSRWMSQWAERKTSAIDAESKFM